MADEGIVAILEHQAKARDEKDELAVSIVGAGTSLKFATMAMRSCYTTNAPTIAEFHTLRDDVSTRACVYQEKVLPLAKRSLQMVKDFVVYFQDLPFETCLTIATEIAKEARTNQAVMELNRDTHMAMAVEFKQFEDQIEMVLGRCRLEAKAQQEKMESLRSAAGTKQGWAIGLSFVPVVGAIASPMLMSSACGDLEEATAAKEEAEMAVAASIVVKDVLQRALAEYCSAMDRCAGEFQNIASDCETFAGQTENLGKAKKQAFHMLMQARAQHILDAVKVFQQVCVSAETDLQLTPESPEPNYVQQWLNSKRQGNGPTFMERIRALIPDATESMPQLMRG